MLQLQGHGSQEEPGPQVMAAHAPKSGQGGRVSLRHWHSGPGVGSGAVGTHRAILQLQGHGSQEKPGPQVMAAHARKSGQGGKDLLGQLQRKPRIRRGDPSAYARYAIRITARMFDMSERATKASGTPLNADSNEIKITQF